MLSIAYLILAHRDPIHIKRLAIKLSKYADVFIHIDVNSNIDEFKSDVSHISNVHFLEKRLHCDWGGWNAVNAEIYLIETALAIKKYDRFVLLQGADYPIKSSQQIISFFTQNKNTEFIRGCCCTTSTEPYFYYKCRYYHFNWEKNKLTKIISKVLNKITSIFRLKLKDGYIHDGDQKYMVYWGSAQWALTYNCSKYIVEFYKNHPHFNKWFKSSFPPDELYFPTVVMNSPYRSNTTYHGPEPEKKGLCNWRNLHYFEYPKYIRVFTKEDFQFLKKLKELYIRKVNTECSSGLLDLIDSFCK